MQPSFDWKTAQRQPIAAVTIAVLRGITSIFKMIWPLLLALVFSNRKGNNSGTKWLLIGGAIVVVGLIRAVLDFFYFRFAVTDTALMVRKGFFKKTQIDLPLEKVQAVHLDQDWLHRLLQLTKVSVDSPGSANAEIQFSLKESDANALQQRLLHQRSADTVSEAMPEDNLPFLHLRGSDLVKLGLSANFLRAFFILIAFAGSIMDNLQVVTGEDGMWWNWVTEHVASGTRAMIAATAIVVLLVSIVVSFVLVVLQYGNFTLYKSNTGFHIKTGLINRREKLVPFKKIQYLSWHANWIRRHLPYYVLNFHAIGEEASKNKWSVNVPVTQMDKLPGLLEPYHPMLATSGTSLKMHTAYLLRTVLIAFFASVFLFIPLYFWLNTMAVGVFLIVPIAYFSARVNQKTFRLFAEEEALLVRRKFFGIGYTLLRWNKVQYVQLRQSRFQVRRDLATVVLHTASGRIKIPWQPLQVAHLIVNYAVYKGEVVERM